MVYTTSNVRTAASSKVGVNPAFDPMKPYHLTATSPCVNAGDPIGQRHRA